MKFRFSGQDIMCTEIAVSTWAANKIYVLFSNLNEYFFNERSLLAEITKLKLVRQLAFAVCFFSDV